MEMEDSPVNSYYLPVWQRCSSQVPGEAAHLTAHVQDMDYSQGNSYEQYYLSTLNLPLRNHQLKKIIIIIIIVAHWRALISKLPMHDAFSTQRESTMLGSLHKHDVFALFMKFLVVTCSQSYTGGVVCFFVTWLRQSPHLSIHIS